MKLEGSFELPAEQSRVWPLLLDPRVLERCLPGCERMEELGPDQYKAVLNVKVAGIQSTYDAEIHLREKRPPTHFRLIVVGQGKGGFANGDGAIDLVAQDDTTAMRYSGDLQVGGLLASVGSRLVESAAKKILREFLKKLAQEISAGAASAGRSVTPDTAP